MREGRGERLALLSPEGVRWTYAELDAQASRIAHVLVDELGVVPGNRVLLRGPNTPAMAACWFAVMKAGAIAVADDAAAARAGARRRRHQGARQPRAVRLAARRGTRPRARGVPDAGDGGAVRDRRRRRRRGARRGEAAAVPGGRHRGRRRRVHRLHVGHHRHAEGHDALPPRRARGVRLLAAGDAEGDRRRPLHRQPAARVHLRAGRAAAVSAAHRRGDAAGRAARPRGAARGDRDAPGDGAVHGADVVPRDGAAGGRSRPRRRCANASPPARRCRRRRARCGRRRPASRSSTASARPRCCTSSSRTRTTTRGPARPARSCPATAPA